MPNRPSAPPAPEPAGSPAEEPGRRRPMGGRPRDPQIDGAILGAVRALLAEEGYAKLSFETVARRAGVTRPTIYRRWSSKAQLVHEAVFPTPGHTPLIPDTGDFAADVRRMVATTVASYSRPEARAALPGLFGDLHDRPDLRATVIDGLETRVREHFRSLVAAAVARGEVRADADADVVFDALMGAVFNRTVVRGDMSEEFVERLAGVVVEGVRGRE
ncbi:TetR/AcrR family transcriptional regulator [Uniformispora flossi]|uniref:TetR/AcrR family transcriptional regulator n=1 Tax=Uniformispora flossi TaxID=3390723 RepID=UPI003C30DCC4